MTKPVSRIIAFDIDGTILNDYRQISEQDLSKLHSLKDSATLRIAATGRNYYSVQRVLPSDFPIDYLVFSSGAGIMEWRTKKILKTYHLEKTDIKNIINLISPHNLNFTIHLPIPDNHHILLFNQHAEPEDLINYTSFYKEFVKPLHLNSIPEKATQIIVLLNSHTQLFNHFKELLSPLKTILTTSPINHKSMWMEVFNANVSKANGIKWIIEKHRIENPFVFTIGNDYNDLDLLSFAHEAFVVDNAPDELKKMFRVSKSNNESGFSEALKLLDI